MEIVIGIIIGLAIGFFVGKLMEGKKAGEEKTQLIAKAQVLAANIEQIKLHHASEVQSMKQSHAAEVQSMKSQMENERLYAAKLRAESDQQWAQKLESLKQEMQRMTIEQQKVAAEQLAAKQSALQENNRLQMDETQEVLNTEYMKDLRTSEEQLCFLVESFIKTARLEQEIIQVHTQKENLVETILNALGQIQKKAEDKDIFFQVELPEKIIRMTQKKMISYPVTSTSVG